MMWCSIEYPLSLATSPGSDGSSTFLSYPDLNIEDRAVNKGEELKKSLNVVGVAFREDHSGAYILLLNSEGSAVFKYENFMIPIDIYSSNICVSENLSIFGLTRVKLISDGVQVFNFSFYDPYWKINCYLFTKFKTRSQAWHDLRRSLNVYRSGYCGDFFEKYNSI